MSLKIIESDNALSLLDVIQYVFDKYTIEKDSEIKTLTMTGITMDQLSRLVAYTTKDHFQIWGNAVFAQNWKEDALDLLYARHTDIFLSIRLKWGHISIFWDRPDIPQNQHIEIRRPVRESFSIHCTPKQESDYLLDGYDFKQQILRVLPIVGILPEGGSDQDLPDGTRVRISMIGAVRRLSLYFKEEQYVEKIKKLLECFLEHVPQPDDFHLSLTSDFRTIKYLHESGKVKPCKKCCRYHLAYDHLQRRSDSFDPGRLHELAKFLINEPARDRTIRFEGFRWTWESEAEPDFVNELEWRLSKRKPPSVYMLHYFENPLPRGLLSKIRADASSFLERSLNR